MHGVALDVSFEFGLRRVGARMRIRQAARGVVEGGGGPGLSATEDTGDRGIAVVVVRVGHRELVQERPGVGAVVLRVDAEEAHLAAVLACQPLEKGELVTAGPAPGGPLVDHDRTTPQRGQASFEALRATVEDLVGLAADLGEGRGGRSTSWAMHGGGGLARWAKPEIGGHGEDRDQRRPAQTLEPDSHSMLRADATIYYQPSYAAGAFGGAPAGVRGRVCGPPAITTTVCSIMGPWRDPGFRSRP